MIIFFTGAAGFIGFHVAKKLLERGESVIGYDNLNDYCSVELKRDRLCQLNTSNSFTFHESDLEDSEAISSVVNQHRVTSILHLPMQPGDVEATWADVSELKRDFDYQPTTDLRTGLEKFVSWYRDYYAL